MRIKEFKQWLKTDHIFTTDKQISDCLSRIAHIERAFSAFGVDLDQEYISDKGARILLVLAREGQNVEAEEFDGIDLPINHTPKAPIPRDDRRLGMYNNAFKKYILFSALSEGYPLEDLAKNPRMKLIVRNYLRNH